MKRNKPVLFPVGTALLIVLAFSAGCSDTGTPVNTVLAPADQPLATAVSCPECDREPTGDEFDAMRRGIQGSIICDDLQMLLLDMLYAGDINVYDADDLRWGRYYLGERRIAIWKGTFGSRQLVKTLAHEGGHAEKDDHDEVYADSRMNECTQ